VTRRSAAAWVTEALVVAGAFGLLYWAWRADGPWLEQHAHAYRCLHDAHLVSVVRVERGIAAAVVLVLLFFVRPRMGRLVQRAAPSAGAIARVGVAALLALVTAEVILRRPWANPPPPPVRDYCPPERKSDVYLWGLQPSTTYTWHAGGRSFSYYVNAEANRARSLDALPDHSRPTIFVAGESTALGMGIPYEETFGALLEDRTGVQVVNVAGAGYGADQAYLRMAEVVESFARPLAIVTVFVAEEAIRAENEDQPHLRPKRDGTLEPAPPTPAWLRSLRVRAVLRNAVDYHGDLEVEALRAIVRATADFAHKRAAYPLFVTTNFEGPCIDVDGRGPWLFHSLFEDQGIPRVHLDLDRTAKIGTADPHPGAVGNRLIADAVENALRAAHVLP
jgi:hypothetical protein